MNKIDRLLLNKVHIFLAECYENNTIIPPNDIVTMFSKIFNADITYIKYCPDGLEDSLQALVKDINESQIARFKELLKVFLVSYYDTIKYDMIKNKTMPARDKDRFWYKSLISQYVLETLLFRNNEDSTIKKFNSEYAQIGSLISKFYSEEDTSKSKVIKDIIKSKIQDIYNRYNYKYDLPSLCA